MSFSASKRNPLDVKVPDNPRYKHIKAVVDSGASMNKYYERLDEIRRNYKYRKNEIFRRIKCPTFIQLVLQISSIGIEEGQLSEDCPIHNGSQTTPIIQTRPSSSPLTPRSTLSDLVLGVGELDVSDHTPSPSPIQSPVTPPSTCPYLLLDVREKEQYDSCHIITARSYPSILLTRSVNPYTRELFEYKNKRDSIIIIYDEDESISRDVATKLVQRDFENIFVLSGGIKVLYQYFPCGIIAGILPLPCCPSPVPSSSSGRRRSSQSRQKPVIAGEMKDYFTMDDLLCLQQRLDEVLLSSAPPLSSASTRATCSRYSSRSSVSSTSSSGGKPRPQMWKY